MEKLDDDLGKKYEQGLKKENVQFFYSKKGSNSYWNLFDINNPDSERTMVTFLGTAEKLTKTILM